jgi:splicing factor 3A subunit 3
VKKLVDMITSTSHELIDLYADRDRLLHEEVANMRGNQMFKSFYESLNSTREYHVKYPNLEVSSMPTISDEEIDKDMQFSGEEVYGKYLDLHELFLAYLNIPNITSVDNDYLTYLDRFNSFFHIPEQTKLHNKAYVHYLDQLWSYLSSFFHRIQPLVDQQDFLDDWKKSFEELWSSSKLAGWKAGELAGSKNQRSNGKEPQPLRLGMFNTAEELEALGMDRLKEALEAVGLKCGGTLHDRAQRLWSIRGKREDEIPEKLRAKKRKFNEDGADDGSTVASEDKRKAMAWLEYRIVSITSMMMDIVIATRKHVSKQQIRTIEEKEMELYEAEYGNPSAVDPNAMTGQDEDEEPIYNPLNLPLGWDGKPIPYWLYKLHGLGVEFKCEICGNQSYWGRRNFDKHFQEWKHAYGMRCLGIPNTKHFHDITLIQDAVTLYNTIRGQLKNELFVADLEEEFEDSQGNVLNRRTYEDLARQGLL